MSIRPLRSVDELFARNEEFVENHLTPDSRDELRAKLPSPREEGNWIADPPFIAIHGLLRPASRQSMDTLPFNNGRCTVASEHPVAKLLIPFIVDVSTFNVVEHPLLTSRVTVKQLSNAPDTPESLQTLVPPHQDHGDGHATIYHWAVIGRQLYRTGLGDEPMLLEDNMLTALLGNYDWIGPLGYYGTDIHEVFTDVDPNDPEYAQISRNRILGYCDGEDTGYQGDFDPAAYANSVFRARRQEEAVGRSGALLSPLAQAYIENI